MTEQIAETQQTPPEGTETPEPKTFDAEYVEKLRKEAAKYRTEAKANSEAAKRLAEIEEANKSEVQKAAERLAVVEHEAEEARREALRFKIAAKFQIGDEDADLFLTGSNEELLTKQAERLTARESERKKNGNHVPREGNHPKSAGSNDEREFVNELWSTASTD